MRSPRTFFLGVNFPLNNNCNDYGTYFYYGNVVDGIDWGPVVSICHGTSNGLKGIQFFITYDGRIPKMRSYHGGWSGWASL